MLFHQQERESLWNWLLSGGNCMDEEQKKWQEQFWNSSGGTREVFRLGCAIALWQGMGLALTIWSGNVGYMMICLAIFFIFPTLTAYWQSAYSLLRKIIGNQNMPSGIMSYKHKWWSYIPLAIKLIFSAALLIKGIELLIK